MQYFAKQHIFLCFSESMSENKAQNEKLNEYQSNCASEMHTSA